MSLSMMIYTDDYSFSITNYIVFILIIILTISSIRTRNLYHTICATIFGIYLLFLIQNTFFPLHISGGFADMMRAGSFMAGVNLIPFNFSPFSEFSSVIRELALNFALLVPFGFGLSFFGLF